MPFSRLADHILAASAHMRHGGENRQHFGNMGAAGLVGGIIGSMINNDNNG